jgi:Phosphopantetheinyl transferase
MPTLTDKTLYIHLLQPDGYADDVAVESLFSLEEHQRAQSYRFRHDRNLYVAAHLFLRRTLSRYAPVSPAQWTFSYNTYGKPVIANPGYKWLQFNLSHTHGMVACAITRDRLVGVDVEKINLSSDLPALCQYALTPIEIMDVLSACDKEEQARRFFTYWTLKEAYIKARGIGLSLPLQQFAFQQGKDHVWHLYCNPVLQDKGGNWRFDAFQIGKTYSLAYFIQTDIEETHLFNIEILEENSSSNILWKSDVEITLISC